MFAQSGGKINIVRKGPDWISRWHLVMKEDFFHTVLASKAEVSVEPARAEGSRGEGRGGEGKAEQSRGEQNRTEKRRNEKRRAAPHTFSHPISHTPHR